LVRDLQDRFPHARLIGGDAQFEKLFATVFGFVEAPPSGSTYRSMSDGTTFQQSERLSSACLRREMPPIRSPPRRARSIVRD
jgi:AraC family transcriptional regulator of adaptative response/methylated-DNA-[protein]-cysteine methyltransferase